jgi:hypothetical protein
MGEQKNRLTYGWKDRLVDRQRGRRVVRQTEGQADRGTGRHRGGKSDIWIEKQTGRKGKICVS